MGSSAQGHGPVEASFEEGHKDENRAGVLLRKQTERVRVVQSAEEVPLGRCHCSISALRGGL